MPPGRRRPIGAAIGATCLALAGAVAAYSTISYRDNRATVATSAGSTSTPPAAPSHAGNTTTVLNKLLTAPDRSDPAAPFDPALQPYLLRVSDWPGSAVTTLAASKAARSPGPGSIIGQFSPCGYPFDDTSTASGHATTTLANPNDASGLKYVYEDIAAFSLTQAQQLLADFREHADSCHHYPGLRDSQAYDDIPVINGQPT